MQVIKCPKCKSEKTIETDYIKNNRRVYRCHSCQTKYLSDGMIVTDVDKNIVTCKNCGATFDKTKESLFRIKGKCFCGEKV